jgi:hypothetical protein
VSLPPKVIGRAQLERMWAPSIGSRSGVSLGGRIIGADGLWHGRALVSGIDSSGGGCHVLVPGYSAALVQEVKA